jgi:hypothetical protein
MDLVGSPSVGEADSARTLGVLCWGARLTAGTGSGGSRAGIAGEQGDEDLGVGAAPAGDRIPAGCGLVAGDRPGREPHGVVARGDVVEGLVVVGTAGDLVDRRVDEAQVAPRVLVGQRDERGPDRGAGAGPAVALDGVPGAGAEDNRHACAVAGIGGHVGNPSGGASARDAGLVGGPGEQLAEPATGGLEGPALVSGVSGRQAPGRLADPGAGGMAGGQAGAPGGQDERIGGQQADPLPGETGAAPVRAE